MKVILLDDFHSIIRLTLEKWGWEVVDAKDWKLEDFKINIIDVDGIFIRSSLPLNREALSHAKKLKFIARPGSGLENIDLSYCKLNQISVFRSPEGNRDAVAEHTMGMLLMLVNNLKRADSEVRSGIWRREANRGSELMGKTFAIIGYGYMGKALSERLTGFGLNVIAYDKYLSDFGSNYVKEVELEEIFETADFVSLHTPLSNETIGMVDYLFLSKFQNPIVLINTARGKSVILKDILKALRNGFVSGACLDVLELESSSFEKFNVNENSDFTELSKMSNVILSPHIAGWTEESKHKMAKVVLQKVKEQYITS